MSLRGPVRRAALALAVAVSLVGAGDATAYNPGFDPGSLPALPCQGFAGPAQVLDYWCGTWDTATPANSAIKPLGAVTLERVDPAAARAAIGKEFGDFRFDRSCESSAIWFRGTYLRPNGVPGQVLACSSYASDLEGQYRDDPQPTLPFHSGWFKLTYRGGSPPAFTGQLIQYFAGSTGAWSGTCTAGDCLRPPQDPSAATTPPPPGTPSSPAPSGPSPAAPPTPAGDPFLQLLEGGNTGSCLASPIRPGPGAYVSLERTRAGTVPAQLACQLPPAGREAVQTITEASYTAVLLSCLGSLGVTGASALAPALLPGAILLAKVCAASFLVNATGQVTLYRDPPDGAFRRVALPRARPEGPGTLATLCRPGRTGPACTRPLPAARRYLAAIGAVASLQEATAVAVNRLATARAAKDNAGAALQFALMKVYAGPLASAAAEQQAAGRALARELRRSGIALRLSAAQADRARRSLLELRGVPAPILARLRAIGLGRTDVVAAMRSDPALARPPGPLDLGAVLGRRLPTAGLTAFHRSITALEVALIARALGLQGAIRRGVAEALVRDVGSIDRRAGARRFLARVKVDVKGRYGELLQVAAAPLAR